MNREELEYRIERINAALNNLPRYSEEYEYYMGRYADFCWQLYNLETE